MSARRWRLPSVSVLLWLVFFLALNLTPVRVTLVSADSDPCWHWRHGNWMIQHRAVLRTDEFSHTRAGAPLVDLWWLSEIVTALAGRALGWGGIVLVASTLCATIVWLLHRQLLAEGNELVLCTALVLVAAAACATHWLARPHLVTQLFVVVFGWQLRWFDRGRVSAKRLLVVLPLLMVLWTNLHGAFIAGLVLIGVYLAGSMVGLVFATQQQPAAPRHKTVVLSALAIACLLASLVNPFGWKLHVHIIEVLRSPVLAGFFDERVPVFYKTQTLRLLVGLVALPVLLLVVARPRVSVTDGLLLAVWLYYATRMARNVPLFALVATPILAEHWNTFLSRGSHSLRRFREFSDRLSEVDRTADGRGLAVAVAIVIVLLLSGPRLVGGPPLLNTEIPTDKFPVVAVAWVRAHPDAVRGEMFNDFLWGGYLVLMLPEHKVFVYGRLTEEDWAQEFNEVDDVQPTWRNVLDRDNVGWTILPRAHRLNHVLAEQSDWKPVYADDVAVIYGRRP